MAFQFPFINYLYLFACGIALVLSVVSRGQRSDPTGRYWLAVLISFVIWTAGEFLANLGTTLHWQLGFQRVVYLGVVCSVVSWMLFAIHFSGNQRWLTPAFVGAILLVPVLTLIQVFTVEWHGFFYNKAELILRNGYYVLDLGYGLGFWLQIIFSSYLYTLVGSMLLIGMSIQHAPLYRSQTTLIVVAAAIPLVVNVYYIFGGDFAGGFDPTSLFFVFSAILITVATHQYFFLRLAPMARDLVFRNINSGVLVVNDRHAVTDVNPAFAGMAVVNANDLIGMPVEQLLESMFDTSGLDYSAHGFSGRVSSLHHARQFEISSMPIKGYRNESLGMLILLTDITQLQRALDEISRLAHTDLLTQLPNRRALIDWVSDLSEIDTMFQPALVVMADLDHFKTLNDAHGHHCGDMVLKEMATLISAHLNSGDIVARWGGEEFCLVLTRRSWEQGEQFLEILRKEIEDHVFQYEGDTLHVTITFGMVQHARDEDLEYSIKRADQMMYEGKRKGRNVVLASKSMRVS